MAFRYKSAVLGGTFDHLHAGHKELLEYGLSLSEKLIIGVTSDEYVNKTKNSLQDFSERKKELEEFLNKVAQERFEIVKIDDLYGPTLDNDFFSEAIIISPETKEGAEKINAEREKKGLKKLDILEAEQVLAEDGLPISSERIRNGEINREGKLFINKDWLDKDLKITDEIREELKRPFGDLFKTISGDQIDKESFLISVGDETAKNLNELGLTPDLAVVDFKVARKIAFSDIKELGFGENTEVTELKNPPGTVTCELTKTILEIIKNIKNSHAVVLIDGEDDLAVLPLILSLPLGSLIFYGQPGEGVVKIKIEENNKAKAHEIMARFQTLGY